MTNPREKQIAAFLEMCEVYIAQCPSSDRLEVLGYEIADLRPQVGALTKDLEEVKRKYLAKRKELI